jgi:hypothetical protein
MNTQLELPMFSPWHKCLDVANHPADVNESCSVTNPKLWVTWCFMKNRPTSGVWAVWTEQDVVDWVNATIHMENKPTNDKDK